MDGIGTVGRHFQLLRQNCDLEITYSLITCYKHLREKGIVCSYFGDDKDIVIKVGRVKFEDMINALLLKNSGWYIVPSFYEYKINGKVVPIH